jgi:hypothetical protein
MKLRLIIFSFMMVVLSACAGISIERNADGSTSLNIGFTESEVNSFVQSALANNPNVPLRNTSVDLQNGLMVISGQYDRPNNGGTSNGTITLTMTVANGALQAQATNINVDGLTLDPTALQQFNNQLAQALGGNALQNNSGATLQSVTISADRLTIRIRLGQ